MFTDEDRSLVTVVALLMIATGLGFVLIASWIHMHGVPVEDKRPIVVVVKSGEPVPAA